MITENPIFYALDFSSIDKAKDILQKIKNHIGGIKIGLEFFVANGRQGLQEISKFNLPIFLDLKLYDIPNTIEKTVKEISKIEEVIMTTLHISGGAEMLQAAVRGNFRKSLKLLGVTILTSTSNKNNDFKYDFNSIANTVVDMAFFAKDLQLDGVVCSGLENQLVRNKCGNDLLIVNPGIRMLNNHNNDQKRIATPQEAIKTGANVLVIGRAITNSNDPVNQLQQILNSLQ